MTGLRAKLIGVFAIFAFVLVVTPLVLSFGLTDRISAMEQADIDSGYSQVQRAGQLLSSQLFDALDEYAHRDDLIKAISGEGDDVWFQIHVVDAVAKHFGHSYVMLVDDKGKLLWRSGDAAGLGDSAVGLPLMKGAALEDRRSGFAKVPDGFGMFAAMPITDAKPKNPDHPQIYGTLIFGRRVDAKFAVDVAGVIGRDIALFDQKKLFADSAPFQHTPPDAVLGGLDAKGLAASAKQQTFSSPSSTAMFGYVPVQSSSGEVVGTIRLAQDRVRIDVFRRELLRAVMLFFLVTMLLFIVIAWLTGRWYVLPVMRLSDVMHRYASRKRYQDKELAERDDEMGDLYRSFAGVVSELEEHRQEIALRERELQSSNRKLAANAETLNKTKESLETKLEEISKLNKFMVGREVRMAELKKQLKEKERK